MRDLNAWFQSGTRNLQYVKDIILMVSDHKSQEHVSQYWCQCIHNVSQENISQYVAVFIIYPPLIITVLSSHSSVSVCRNPAGNYMFAHFSRKLLTEILGCQRAVCGSNHYFVVDKRTLSEGWAALVLMCVLCLRCFLIGFLCDRD